jgi:hypothetical protein
MATLQQHDAVTLGIRLKAWINIRIKSRLVLIDLLRINFGHI